MDGHDETRLAELLQRQKRKSHAPAILRAWADRGATATLLADSQHAELISWLRANWRQPDQSVAEIHGHVSAVVGRQHFVIVANFWEWDEAVAILVSATDVLRIENKLRQIYPDGFLIVDQHLQSALIVDFDDHAGGAEVSMIGPERTV